jgi:preprotein translocase subunit SecE
MAENSRLSKLAGFGRKIARFFKDIRSELKKVIWPSREQLVNNTISVLIICLLTGIVIWVSDEILKIVLAWTLSK